MNNKLKTHAEFLDFQLKSIETYMPNEKSIALTNELGNLLFSKKRLMQLSKSSDFIGSIPFHEQVYTINAMKLRLITIISEL